jgi:hypothetical protein
LGGEFVDDLESADVGVDASLDVPDAVSDGFDSDPPAPASFEGAPSVPDFP